MTPESATDAQPYHYAVIGRAIAAIAARAPEQAPLEEVAASVGLNGNRPASGVSTHPFDADRTAPGANIPQQLTGLWR